MYISRIAENIFLEYEKRGKVIILLGARQVGKTTLIKKLLSGKKAVFLNLDIEVDKQRLLAASHLTPSDAIKSFENPDYIIIDEAQRLQNSARIIKGWYDAEVQAKMVLLGSSSLDIANQSVESLTGRNAKLYLPPLLFREIIANQPWYSPVFTDIQIQNNFSQQIQSLLWQNIIFGSYPEIVVSAEKRDLLFSLAFDYLYKDILQLGLVKTPDLIKKLLMLLAYQIGSEVSVNEISTSLAMSRITVDRYLHLLEQAFVIFRLPAYSTNRRKEIVKNHKIYFWDTGIRNAVLNDFNLNEFRPDIGAIWENWVISEIAKENILTGNKKNLYFWRSRSGSEVDLIITENKSLRACEIKWKEKKYRSNQAFTNVYKIPVEFITSGLKSLLPFIR